MSRVQQPSRSAHVGFGLIELMVALTLGLLVLGAAIAIFQSNLRTFKANEGVNRMQEGARVAYELMARDLRAVGGTACSNLAMPDLEHSNTTEEDALLAGALTGNGSELTVTSGDDSAYRVESATASSVTLEAGQVSDLNEAFKVNDKVILCNANQLYVVTLDGVNNGSRTLTYTPALTTVMTSDPMAPPSTVMVARYRSNRWFVDGNELKVSRNGGSGESVVDGVTGMALTYLEEGATSYVASPTNWPNVIAVRMALTLEGKDKADGKTISRSTSNVISLRSRTP